MTGRKKKDWQDYPIRRCITMHGCALCGEVITMGDQYRDGGYGRRAHLRCVIDRPARPVVDRHCRTCSLWSAGHCWRSILGGKPRGPEDTCPHWCGVATTTEVKP